MDWIGEPEVWSALATLLALEIVLGVDNVVFISILASKLPADQQQRARQTGLLAAGGMRILLLLLVGWIVTLKKDLFEVFDIGFSGKELILLVGGAFLIYKATTEIHERLEGAGHEHGRPEGVVTFTSVMVQVLLLDLVFSIDSVITAVGMTEYVGVMIAAVVTAVGIMLFASKSIYGFVNEHPTVKMLALAFLLMIGMLLIAEGFGQKVPKGYMYSAITFSIFVEVLNLRSKRRTPGPVALHEPYLEKHPDLAGGTTPSQPGNSGR
ncbi:MAG TPA: TerC family protein [Acidimicrobiia bacterium]|nr:TerC family protein [Acidimicrobiia bacterium]